MTTRIARAGVAGSGGSGDASAAKQDDQTALLTTIDAATSGISTYTGQSTAHLIDVKSKQDAQTALLGTMDTDTGNIATAVAALVAALVARDSAPSASQPTMAIGGIRDDALASISGEGAEGDIVLFRMDGNGAVWTMQAGALSALVDSIAHKTPGTQLTKSFNATSQQTGSDVWTPAAGKNVRVQGCIIGTYGTTAGRLILWFGANADTTYTEGTDQPVFKGSFAPSATAKPGAVVLFDPPLACPNADYEVHCTTDAGMSLDVVMWGYEE